MADIGPAPGRRSAYNPGQYASTPWSNLYGGNTTAGPLNTSVLPTLTSGNTGTTSSGGVQGYQSANPYSDPSTYMGSTPNLPTVSAPDLSSFGSLFGNGWTGGTSQMMGVDIPAIETPQYIQPSLPIAEWKDYPGLDYALKNMASIYPNWERIAPQGFDRLETAIRDKISLPLQAQQAQDTTRFWGEAAKRGLGNDPAAMKLYSQTVQDPYATQYRVAATDATQQRYALEAADKQAYNQGLTGRVDKINDTMTYRTDQANKFNQWQTGESDTRANMENGFNMTGAQMSNSLNNNYWTTLQNQYNQLLALWASMIKNQSNGSGSYFGFGAGIGGSGNSSSSGGKG